MIMVCPNCQSDQVIEVQDQHFCINCGQVVPDLPVKGAKGHIPLQDNGLPEGVKILPVAPAADKSAVTPVKLESLENPVTLPVESTPPVSVVPQKPKSLIQSRSRIEHLDNLSPARTKRRKPGRPKAGRLDVPRILNHTAPASLPPAPNISSVSPALSRAHQGPVVGPKTLSDISPRKSPHTTDPPAKTLAQKAPAPTPPPAKKLKHKKARAHKVGIPAIHYGPIISFSLRSRARPHFILLAAGSAMTLGAACAYGVWILLTRGVNSLATGLISSGPKLIVEVLLLALLYYIGRSLGQTAIIYGIARESDDRPVTMSRQLGVAVNTFARRIILDSIYGIGELGLIAAGGLLLLTGGEEWPVDPNIQIAAIFAAFLIILYTLSALAISRGLAGVNLTLTSHRPRTAARLGWQLFSHRIELIGPRFGSLLLELLLAVPLVSLVVAFCVTAPPRYHLEVAVGAGLIAWLSGSLLGAGTAAWWTMLYRQLVVTDRPNSVANLLSGRQPEDARARPLIFIVSLSTLLLAASIVLPWIKLY